MSLLHAELIDQVGLPSIEVDDLLLVQGALLIIEIKHLQKFQESQNHFFKFVIGVLTIKMRIMSIMTRIVQDQESRDISEDPR